MLLAWQNKRENHDAPQQMLPARALHLLQLVGAASLSQSVSEELMGSTHPQGLRASMGKQNNWR